jgi:Ca2+-binding EF-hand superfamily protein
MSFAKIDKDANGTIDFTEYLCFMNSSNVAEKQNKEDIEKKIISLKTFRNSRFFLL